MTARPAFRVISGDGEIIETPDTIEENKALRAALTRLQNSYNALARDRAAERKTYPSRAIVEDAFEDWKTKLVDAGHKGKARCKLSDDRFDAMKAMVEAGYTLDDFLLVNAGIVAAQYVVYGKRRATGPADSLELDIAYVCEKARRFEEAARIGAIVEKSRKEVAA